MGQPQPTHIRVYLCDGSSFFGISPKLMTSAKASPIAAHPVIESMTAMPNRAAANQAKDLRGLSDTDVAGWDMHKL